jgi:hypothetical protein
MLIMGWAAAADTTQPYEIEPLFGFNGGDVDGFAQTREGYLWLAVNGTVFR